MAIYFGKSEDGSDMQEHPGMFVSPCGKYWSNQPFTKPKQKMNWRKAANRKRR